MCCLSSHPANRDSQRYFFLYEAKRFPRVLFSMLVVCPFKKTIFVNMSCQINPFPRYETKNLLVLLCELFLYNFTQPQKKRTYISLTFLLINDFFIYRKLDYLYFSAFDLKEKVTEILTNILPFSGETHDHGRETNYQVLGRYLLQK